MHIHIERGRKRSKGSLKEYKDDEYLEYRMYWCSFGPENYGEGGDILPSRRYRLNTRNRAARPQSMCGCTCHFVVKRLYAWPSLALLIYNDRWHMNKSGFVCHGPLDKDAIGPGAKNIPYIGSEIQQQMMSLIYLGILEENVLEKHIEGIQHYCGSDMRVNNLASRYVHKLGMIIRRSSHELYDQASIRMWVERNKKSIFFYQDTSEKEAFILGIQTEWQLQQMIRFGHGNLMAAGSTFGIKRLKHMGGSETLNELGKLLEDFVDQTAFMEYFKATWVPKLEMWLSTMRCLPLASQEASGAIEAYHVKLKTKLFDDSHLGALQRVDWLVHKLTMELRSSYWLDRYADESDSFQNVKEAYINSTSWHRALQILDSAVSLDEKDRHFSKVKSLKESNLTRLVWNPGSEFAFCDCPWSLQGNLCKHVIKVNIICESSKNCQLFMSCQSLKETMLDIWRRPVDDSMSLDLSMSLTFQMLDQIQNLVEYNTANDISSVVNKLPVNWASKKARTSIGIPSSVLDFPSNTKSIAKVAMSRRKICKRKRLSRLEWY